MGISTIPLTGDSLPAAVAARLLEQYSGTLPDLSGLIVLVPNHRSGQDFARSLARSSGLSALIPPNITPLKTWAASSSAHTNPEPHSRRLARLHGVLRRETWLGNVDKWMLTQELLTLADELSGARLGKDIAARIRALHSDSLDSETRLIEAVWKTLNQDGSDPQACYARELDALIEQASKPLAGFALGPLTALEQNFFERYSERASVQIFTHTAVLDSADTHERIASTLHATWYLNDAPIKSRAESLALIYPQSPLSGQIKLYAAPHLEAEARAVASWVSDQLHAGRRAIALIALDRECARRTRALLERLQVRVADETGWMLSTTAAAAMIDRWLECVARDFPHTELLDCLKSPFVLGDVATRQDAVLALELAMRKQGISNGMTHIRRLAQNEVLGALPWLDTLMDGARSFNQSRATLSTWLTRLRTSLDAIGALELLAADVAGASVMATLEQATHELADDREKYSFSEWRRWLNLALENASFMDTSIASPVVLTSLPAARGRMFEAIAVIGADAQHLPARPAASLFSQSTRTQLGLPTSAEYATQTMEDLVQLLPQGPSLLSWQAWKDDEPKPASPLIIRLQTLHIAAWGCPLETQMVAEPAAVDSAQPPLAQRPVPAVDPACLPRRYSPTAYQTLIDCPYRFFVRNVLGLNTLDEADDTLDKSDYGNALHRILKRFHDTNPPPEAAAALALLQQLSDDEFAGLPAFTALSWHIQWTNIQPAYIDSWLAQVAEGWHYQSGETVRELTLDLPALGAIKLQGRIDRIDQKNDHVQVIDYKTSSTSILKKKRDAPEENVQLPFYAYLCDAAAAYLPINDPVITPLFLDGEKPVEAITLRLPMMLESIAQGAGLPAQGVDAICSHCDARGLCRKGMWAVS